jgi:hypothetical protein
MPLGILAVAIIGWSFTASTARGHPKIDFAGAGLLALRQTDHLRPEAGFRREAGTLNFGSA